MDDASEWVIPRDSSPLAESAARGGLPEHVDPANDRAARATWRAVLPHHRAAAPRD